MENNTNTATLNAPVVLTEKVKALKLIAREALRMELISPRLAEIGRLEKEIAEANDETKILQKGIDIANYKVARLSRLDADHPDFENLKKFQEEIAIDYLKDIETLNKRIENLNKEILTQKEAIAKIETGETLVSAEDLANLVDKLILQDAKNTITQ